MFNLEKLFRPTVNPIPWYTYPAIDYLSCLDLSNLSVFEFGQGDSTKWWQTRAKRVDGVDNNPSYTQHRFTQVKEEYINACVGTKWDIIVIDGEWRTECVSTSVNSLADGGMIILDNSDWFTTACANLRASGLVQVDFIGYGPRNHYKWATSMFLDSAIEGSAKHKDKVTVSLGIIDEIV